MAHVARSSPNLRSHEFAKENTRERKKKEFPKDQK